MLRASLWSPIGSLAMEGGSVKALEASYTVQEASEGSEGRTRWLSLMGLGVGARAGVPDAAEVPTYGEKALV